MSGFPYPDAESYPNDDVHLQYLKEYNTRTVTGSKPLAVESSLMTWIAVIAMLIVAVDVGVLVYFKKREH
jgi:hypothetical protein